MTDDETDGERPDATRTDPADLFADTDPIHDESDADRTPDFVDDGRDLPDRGDGPSIDRSGGGDDGSPTDPAPLGTEDDPPELTGETAGDRSGPLGGVADRIERRRRDRDDGPYDDLFDEVDVDSIDREALWEQIGADEPIAGTFEEGNADERVVSKSTYCQRCEYFSDPPDLRCSREGTEILEVASMEEFRVRNCPVVAEDEDLENLGGPSRSVDSPDASE